MKKIGILTFWMVPNYGCFLQAYALQKIISDLFPDDDVRQIGYLEKDHYNSYFGGVVKANYRLWPLNPKYYFALIKKKNNAENNYCKLKNSYQTIPFFDLSLKTDLRKETFDIVVLGSDIIWDYTNRVIRREKELLGIGLKAKKIISYAAGAGNAQIGMPVPHYFKRAIKNINMVSVRDQAMKGIIEPILGHEIDVVLDPTLLYDFKSDGKVVKPQLTDFVAVYGNSFKEEDIKRICEYAESRQLKIVNLSFTGERYKWCSINQARDSLSPFEWMGYIKYADCVFTSTYHGFLFSLVFNKKLIFTPTEFVYNKSKLFLEQIGLKNYNLATIEEKIAYEFDYSLINRKIESLKNKSLLFLKDSLKA